MTRWFNNCDTSNCQWDGRTNGTEALPGVYVYILRYIDGKGDERVVAGI